MGKEERGEEKREEKFGAYERILTTDYPLSLSIHAYLSHVAKLDVRIGHTRCRWWRDGGWRYGRRRGRRWKVTRHYPTPRTTSLYRLQGSKVKRSMISELTL